MNPPWPNPCESAFEEMSGRNPSRLQEWILSGQLREAHLSFAAEIFGNTNLPDTEQTLFKLLEHDSPLVREGAAYGLINYGYPIEKLRIILQLDPHPIVQEIGLLIEESCDEDPK